MTAVGDSRLVTLDCGCVVTLVCSACCGALLGVSKATGGHCKQPERHLYYGYWEQRAPRWRRCAEHVDHLPQVMLVPADVRAALRELHPSNHLTRTAR